MFPRARDVLVVVGLCLSSVNGFCVKNNPAEVTSHAYEQVVAVPEPTPAPEKHELLRRESAQVTERSVLQAPDSVCGYINGSSAQPWGCTAKSNCVFATPTIMTAIYTNTYTYTHTLDITLTLPNTASNTTSTSTSTSLSLSYSLSTSTSLTTPSPTAASVLCCDASTGCPALPAPTACVDRGMYDYNKTCTGNCPKDPMTLKCTSGIYLYCNTISFQAPEASALFCNYLSTYEPFTAQTTFAGQGNRTLAATVLHFATTTNPPVPSATGNGTAAATSAAAAAKKSGGSAKGAIIGGVVGGLLGLAVVLGLVLLVLRSRKQKAEKKAGAPAKGAIARGREARHKSVSFKEGDTTETERESAEVVVNAPRAVMVKP